MSEDAKSVMRTSEGDVFDQIAVQKDLERIKKYYKEGKYFNPVVHPYLFEDGVLTITVEPGKRLFISLDGNEALSAKVLLREMPFFEAEDFNNDIVEEAIQRMLTLYHEQGFPDDRWVDCEHGTMLWSGQWGDPWGIFVLYDDGTWQLEK